MVAVVFIGFKVREVVSKEGSRSMVAVHHRSDSWIKEMEL